MKNLFIIGFVALGLSACSTHSLMRGSVATKISDTEAQVCMNKDEVKVGDHLVLYKSVCETKDRKERGSTTCKKVETGHGEISAILNDHYSAIKFPAGTKFAEGDVVEKHVH